MSSSAELLLLLAMYQKKYGTLASKTADIIIKYLNEGYSPEKAISLAFSESNFFNTNDSYIVDNAVASVLLGYDVTSKAKVNTSSIRKTVLHEAWTSDNMTLSKRLHGIRPEFRQNVVDTIKTAMKQQKTFVGMARDLYDGYDSGKKTINQAELPKYLKKLEDAARKVMQGDKKALKEYKAAIANAELNIKKIARNGAPTKNLKIAYENLLTAAKKQSSEALDRAVHVAIEENSRYLADRIARTEMSRAWGDGFFAKYLDDDNVVAFKWRLNSRHPIYDICDIHAHVDCYGLGKGVYPKDKFPVRPAHPHCMCLITPVYAGRIRDNEAEEAAFIKGAKFNTGAVTEHIAGLSRQQQLSVLGVDGLKQFEKDGSWENSLKLWQGHERPEPRIKAKDLDSKQFNKGESAKLFTSDNVIIPEAKILGYSLNKEHPRGGDKAVVFEKVLGYNKDNYQELIKVICGSIDKFPVTAKGTSQFGRLYEIVMDITGPTGRTATVTTGWIVETESSSPRLTSAYIKAKNKGGKT